MAQDPLSAFLGAKERGLGIQRQEQALSQSRQMAPTQQAMADVQLERQRQASTMAGDQRRLQGAELLKNVITKVKQIPDVNQRFEVMQRVRPELQKFGVEMPDFGVENLTDEGLQPLEAGLTGFVSDPASQLSAGEREFRSLSKDLTPEQQERARRIKLGLDPRATGSAAITAATTEGLTEQVAESEREIKSEVKRGEAEASTAGKVIEESFKRVGKIQQNVRNIDRAISALDRGANTGAVQKFMPSVTAASKELEQIRSELGLDVIGAVTFGALSEGELNLALDTALPTGLNEPELKDFLQRKRSAQTKMIDYLDEQMQFLEEGGSVGEWRAFVRGRGQQQPSTPAATPAPTPAAQDKGEGVIMIDANGNKARVFSDGSFEEL